MTSIPPTPEQPSPGPRQVVTWRCIGHSRCLHLHYFNGDLGWWCDMLEQHIELHALTPKHCPYMPDTSAGDAMKHRAEAVRLGHMKSVLDDNPLS